ncbi:MAG: diheme cytochrome C [Elainellaceae cyanobacterium]
MFKLKVNPNLWPPLRRFPGLIVMLCLGLGLALSSQMAIAQTPPATGAPLEAGIAQSDTGEADTDEVDAGEIGTVDPVPPEFQLGQTLYLDACASCHIGIPPAVLPDQTWQFVLDEPGHYGVQISPPTNPGRLLIWQYLQQFSRRLREDEPPPFRLTNSRYFKALHPKVEFEQAVTLQGCVTCHPKAELFNFRALTPDWADAP